MSSNAPEPDRSTDRRVRRTREQLGDALVGLIQEKPFDSITVQDVLDRAGVARSTFYSHYRDKNDLFLSDADEFFEHVAGTLSKRKDPSERVVPVRELFTHVTEMREFHAALVRAGRIHDLWELGRGHFARGIDQRLAQMPRARGLSAEQRKAMGQAFAGSLISLLSWWINRNMPESPEEIDTLYHGLVWSGVQSAVSPS
jgi:AcrR family transcriptional regulator